MLTYSSIAKLISMYAQITQVPYLQDSASWYRMKILIQIVLARLQISITILKVFSSSVSLYSPSSEGSKFISINVYRLSAVIHNPQIVKSKMLISRYRYRGIHMQSSVVKILYIKMIQENANLTTQANETVQDPYIVFPILANLDLLLLQLQEH